MAVDFLAEIIQLVFAKTAFQVSAAINAGRGMALAVDQVAAVGFAFSVQEVGLAATYHGGTRGDRARKSGVWGKRVSVRVDFGGRRSLIKNNHMHRSYNCINRTQLQNL